MKIAYYSHTIHMVKTKVESGVNSRANNIIYFAYHSKSLELTKFNLAKTHLTKNFHILSSPIISLN